MKWYLLKTKFRQEKKSSVELSNQSIVNFFPIFQKEILRKGKVSLKDEPLFSGYIFIYIDPNKINWNALRSTKGISLSHLRIAFPDLPKKAPYMLEPGCPTPG